jgi:hypothetical protein
MADEDQHTPLRDTQEDGPPAGYDPRKRRLSIVITQKKTDSAGRTRMHSHTVPLLGKDASASSPCSRAVVPSSLSLTTAPGHAADKDMMPDELAEGEPDISPGSSPGSSRASSPTDSENSDTSEPSAVDADFAAGLEAMKAQYDRENGIDRSKQPTAPSGGPPLRFRTGRRAAVSIDTSEPIRDEARDKVRQAIVVSLGPESDIGAQMCEELKHVKTVQDLQGFTARNAHNLSELGQIQVEMQMSALGAWKKGFNVLRGAMMFGKLKRGREFDEDGQEIQLTPEEIAAREAAEAAKREEEERRMREAEEEERREREEREAQEAAEREAERIAKEAERIAREKEEAAQAEILRKAEAEKAVILRKAAEAEAERLRKEEEVRQRLEAEEAERKRVEEEREAAIEAARQARLEAIRKSKNLNGSRPIRTPRSSRKKHEQREAALIPATEFKNDATLSHVFAGLGVGGETVRPVSSQSARVASSLGGAMRTFSRGGHRPSRGSVNLTPGATLPMPMCVSPRKGVKGSLPSVSMQRLGSTNHRLEPAALGLARPSTAGLAHLFAKDEVNTTSTKQTHDGLTYALWPHRPSYSTLSALPCSCIIPTCSCPELTVPFARHFVFVCRRRQVGVACRALCFRGRQSSRQQILPGGRVEALRNES